MISCTSCSPATICTRHIPKGGFWPPDDISIAAPHPAPPRDLVVDRKIDVEPARPAIASSLDACFDDFGLIAPRRRCYRTRSRARQLQPSFRQARWPRRVAPLTFQRERTVFLEPFRDDCENIAHGSSGSGGGPAGLGKDESAAAEAMLPHAATEPQMNLNTITEIRRPRSADEIRHWQDGYAWLAGGTWLFSEPQIQTDTLIDLETLGWRAIESSRDGIEFAATCKIAELYAFQPPVRVESRRRSSANAAERSCRRSRFGTKRRSAATS